MNAEDSAVIRGSLPVKSAPAYKKWPAHAEQGSAVKACLYKDCDG